MSNLLFPYQVQTAGLMARERRWVNNGEMGTGKTATTIKALEALNVRTAVIICPASVRDTWLEELDKWWPDHPPARAIEYGRRRALSKKLQAARLESYDAAIKVVSYNLAGEVDILSTDAVVLDEAHQIKNPAIATAKTVRALVRANPDAAVFALTGTFLPNSPKDAWNVVDTLWEGRFGSGKDPNQVPYGFCNRYMNKVTAENEETGEIYGTSWQGLNERHAAEFKARIAAVSTRVTRKDVEHLMPPFVVRMMRQGSTKKAIETFDDLLASEAEAEFAGWGDEKIPHVLAWAENAIEQASHICILTHRKELARNLADKVFSTTGVQATLLTGEVATGERNRLIKVAAGQEKAIIVATMQSVEMGINGLANFTNVLFAEMHYQPKVMQQTAGRFSRISSRGPAYIDILCIKNTRDERQAEILERKLRETNKIIKPGDSEEQLHAAMLDDTPLDESLNQVLASKEEEY